MAKGLTPAQAQATQQVYAGALDAGLRIAGISEVKVSEELAGSKDAPVAIGQNVSVTVRVGEGGRLLPRREDARPTDPPAVSTLRIDVSPDIIFDTDGEPHTVFVAHAFLIDAGTNRVIDSGRSGPTTEEVEAAQGGRPIHEYGNDPEYVDGTIEAEAQSAQDAVAQALGRVDLGSAGSSRKKKVIAAAAGAAVVAIGVTAGVLAAGGNETPNAPTESQENAAAQDESASPSATVPADAETFVLSGDVLELIFSKGKGTCSSFPSSFNATLGANQRGDRVTLVQDGTGQRTTGTVTPEGQLVTEGDTSGHTEIYQLQLDGKKVAGRYSYFDSSCDHHYKVKGRMR